MAIRFLPKVPKSLNNVRYVGTSITKTQGVIEAAVDEWSLARPYSEVPGPTPLPLIGNTWRLLPVVGQYQVSDLARVSQILYDRYGKVSLLNPFESNGTFGTW